jgi:hypothetical protein
MPSKIAIYKTFAPEINKWLALRVEPSSPAPNRKRLSGVVSGEVLKRRRYCWIALLQ